MDKNLIWRDIEHSNYEISNTGIVRNKKTMTVLKHQVKEKYPTVSIRYNDGTVNSKCAIHILLAKAFIDNPYDYPFVDHIDSNPSNYSLDNLRWVSSNQENINNEESRKKISSIVAEKKDIIDEARHRQVRLTKKLKDANVDAKPTDIFTLDELETMRYYTNVIYNDEIWKPIPGYNGKYEASNYGRIRCLSTFKNVKTAICRFRIDSHGYCMVSVEKKEKSKHKYTRRGVHSLVMEAFVKNPNPIHLTMVNHKDCNTLNNQLSNLEWCNHIYNMNYGPTKENISNAVQNFLRTYTFKTKPVIKYNALGFFEKEYSSAKECASEEKIKIDSINSSCCGSVKSVFGHQYKYKENVLDENGNVLMNIPSIYKIFTNQYTVDGKFVAKYVDRFSAANGVGSPSNEALRSHYNKLYYNFYWKKSETIDDISDITIENLHITKTYVPTEPNYDLIRKYALCWFDPETNEIVYRDDYIEDVNNVICKNLNKYKDGDEKYKKKPAKVCDPSIGITEDGIVVREEHYKVMMNLEPSELTFDDYLLNETIYEYSVTGDKIGEYLARDFLIKNNIDLNTLSHICFDDICYNEKFYRYLYMVKNSEFDISDKISISSFDNEKIKLFDDSGNLFKEFENIEEVVLFISTLTSNRKNSLRKEIRNRLNRTINKPYFGYRIVYSKYCGSDKIEKYVAVRKERNDGITVGQYDLEGNLIKIWSSMLKVQKELGYKSAQISKCCNGKIKTSYGFVWKIL